jgi:hypothetical protein
MSRAEVPEPQAGTGGEPGPQGLARAALDLFAEYQDAGELALLSQAVHAFREALASALRVGVPDIAAYHNNLAYALHLHAVATDDAAAQAESVSCHRSAVAATGPEDPDRVPYLCTLVSGLRELYRYTGNAELLRDAARFATEAVQLPGPEPSPVTRYDLLAAALGDLYDHDGDPALLGDTIAACRQAASYAEVIGDPDPAVYWNQLGAWLCKRYSRTGDSSALAEAVQVTRKAVAGTSGDRRLGYLSNLGDALRLTFGRTGDMDALAESVAANRTVVAGTTPGNPDLSRRATHLAGALTCRYQRTGESTALAEAITAARQAVAAAGPDDTELGGYLNNLEAVLELEWQRTGTLATLEDAVRVAREAVAAAPPGHHLRAICLGALASAVSELHDRTGGNELLAEASWATRAAVAASEADGPDRAARLSDLRDSLDAEFSRFGDPAVLAEAIRVARDVIAATPSDHPVRAQRLAGLSALLVDLAERTGDAGPLTEAVAAAEEAVAAVSGDDPGRAALLDDLGSALTSLFTQTRSSARLAEAVRVREEALAATPDGHVDKPARLVNLAATVYTLANRTDDPAAPWRAADLIEDALEALPEDDPARAICMHNLARIYLTLFQRFPEPEHEFLADAVRSARAAVAATPADHADYAGRLATLSRVLLLEPGDAQVGSEPAAVAEALGLARQAVAATPADDPDYARHLNQLGFALWACHRTTGRPGDDAADLAEAWQCFYDAARHPSAPVSLRIGAYRRAAELAAEAGRTPHEALACLEAAVDLVTRVAPGDLGRADQEHEITSVRHLAAHAAGAAVAAGLPERAVELLEQARGVLVARELDQRAGHDDSRPLTAGELSAIASDGPVVYIYVSMARCDALIVRPAPVPPAADCVRVVPLGIAEEEVWAQVDRLVTRVGLEPIGAAPDLTRSGQREIFAVLDWIRRHITGPVLAALGYDRPQVRDGDRPRVWWCPVGPFPFLPLHAACLDEVISSYAFTARSLRYARSQLPPPADLASSPLIVAVPSAPGLPPLRGAEREADVIAEAFPAAVRLGSLTKKALLEALPGHPVAHFACHGEVDPGDPGRSRLLLADHADDPLTVTDIGALRLTGGLAYLSACMTAVTTEELSNEAVHMAGAFQLAGYQHVVGTLWPADDRSAVTLAGDFYKALTAPGRPAVADVTRCAIALHSATRKLRADHQDKPVLWAGHIHTGP